MTPTSGCTKVGLNLYKCGRDATQRAVGPGPGSCRAAPRRNAVSGLVALLGSDGNNDTAPSGGDNRRRGPGQPRPRSSIVVMPFR